MKYNEAPKHWGMEDAHEGFRPDFWQGNNGECAINAQFRILQDYGYTGTVQDLKAEAIEHGWFSEETGTATEDVGRLLELHGVPCEIYYEANRYNLISELAQGKRVIVTVDSSELWRENTITSKLWENLKDLLPFGADHALVVSGIDTSDPDNIQVVLTDSGDGHRTVSYPIEQFEDAWRDGMCQMVVTKTPPPEEYAFDRIHEGTLWPWNMLHFDYAAGHIANIGDDSYDAWHEAHHEELAKGRICDMNEAYFAHKDDDSDSDTPDAPIDSSNSSSDETYEEDVDESVDGDEETRDAQDDSDSDAESDIASDEDVGSDGE